MADRSISVRLSAEIGQFKRSMADAGKATGDLGKQMSGVGEKGQKDFDKIANAALGFGAGVTAAVGFAAKSAMDWETAWTGVLKTVDGTGPQLARLEDGLRGLAKETGFAHSEVAAVAEAAGQLGISTGGVEDFSRTMLDMGVSTNLGAEEAATGLARFRNIMGSSEAEIGNMGSTIVGLGNSFATTESEILDMSMRLAGAGRQAGLTEAEVMGIAAAMSSVGIEAEAGGTALSLTMKRVEKEVADGGAKLKMFADVAGMSTKEFADRWKSDAAGALTAFVEGLSTVDQRGQSANEVLRELGITGIREADALLRLSGNAEGVASAIGMASDAWMENTALTEEAGKFYGTTAQQVKQAWADVRDAGIDAGASLLPVIADGAEGVAKLAQGYAALPDPVKSSSTAIIAMSGVLALGTGAALKANKMLGELSTALGDVGKRQVLLRGAAGVGGAALASLSSTAHETSDGLGILTDTAAGAAMGFAVGGPFGAAIGTGVGAIAGMTRATQSSAEAFDSGRASAMDYAASMDQVTGATTRATQAMVFDDLAKTNAIAAAQALGIANRDLIGFVLGEEDARARVNAELERQKALLAEGDATMLRLDNGGRIDAYNALAQALGLVGDEFDNGKKQAEAAANATKTWEQALEGLPAEVGVELENLNYTPTREQVDDLIARYELTPDQVQTLLTALDRATPAIDVLRARMRQLDGTGAMVRVFADTSAALTAISMIPGVGTPLTAVARVMSYLGNADGGFYSGGVRAFAGGGIDERGRRVPRQPQMRSGSQGAVVWGEAETGWEAYVSGKPGMQDRNRAVLGEAASRLGGDITWYANGGFREAVSPVEMTRLRIRVRDLQRELSAGGEDKLYGLDRLVTQQEYRQAVLDLRAAQAANRSIPRGHTAESWNDARSVAEDFRSQRLDSAAWNSPASFERHMATMLAESAQFTQALAELKKKGASPWLLEQLMQVGPSKSSIRTAKQLASDTARLRRLNAMAGQLGQVAGVYGQLTTDPRFLQAGAANLLATAQARTVNAAAGVTVHQTVNPQPRMTEEQVAQMSVSKILQAMR